MPNVGIARLRVAYQGSRSVVLNQFGQAPLQVHRPLYLEGANYPVVYLRTPSSGLLHGDVHEIEVVVEKGALLDLRTQAATLVYQGHSRQKIRFNIADKAGLIFNPHRLILGKGAELQQEIRIELGEGSSVNFRDSWSAGRIAMGEKWQFTSFDNLIEIISSGELVYRERWVLKPEEADPRHFMLCGDYDQFSNIYSFGPALTTAICAEEADSNLSWELSRQGNRITRTVSRN